MCKQYLLSEGNISKWKEVKLDNIQDFISECNSNVISEFYDKMYNNSTNCAFDIGKMVSDNFWKLGEDVPQADTTSNKTFPITEEQSKLLSDYNKTLDYKCDKCGSSMYANMKFGVVELECENCGYYKEI